ncbi:basic proline-rich protein-like [Meles meles]|uniref:basic proline-rich protein-like n=1 Tax=Meles meles TaxID=9662 RepID=UPI001E69EA20|nr:basic proline-rich protein-like [Meles meles]
MAVTSGVGERTRPFPTRARAHGDMHTRAHRRSPSDTLEGKVKLKAREPGGRREPPLLPRAMTNAAEAAFSPRTPPSHCSHRAPRPRPPDPPPPRLSRVPAPPPHGARGARRAWGARRPRAGAGAGAGGWGLRRAGGRPPRATPGTFAQPLSESPPGTGFQHTTGRLQLRDFANDTAMARLLHEVCSSRSMVSHPSSPPVAVCTIAPARARGCEDIPHLPCRGPHR